MPGGSDGQVGWITEVTPGTALTVTKFMPFLSEGIKAAPEYLDSQTLSARHTLRATKRGTTAVQGPIATELANTGLATLLKHFFGTVATTGAGPYTHTYSPSDLTGDSLTIQVGRPATTTTVHPFTYAGCKVATWEIACNVGELAKLTLNVVGMSETTATALAVASVDSTWAPFTFSEASVTIAGVAATTVKSVTLSGDNKIQPRVRLGSVNTKEPLQNGLRAYGGTVVTDFDALTHYNLVVNGTQAALVLAFNNGTQTLTFTMNVQFVGDTPNVAGFDLLEQPLPYRCISGTSDAAAITAVLVNSETTAA